MSKEENKSLVVREVEIIPPESFMARIRRELREAILRKQLADPIITPSILISIGISAALSGASYLIARARAPKSQAQQQGKMQGYLTIQTQIGSLWPEVYGGDPGDGFGGTWVAPIVVSESKMADVVQVSRQPAGGGKGPRQTTQEVDTTLYYFPYIALGWGRGPLRLLQELANADILYDLYGQVSKYEAEDPSNTFSGTTTPDYSDQYSGGRDMSLAAGASVQFNSVQSNGAATRQTTFSYRVPNNLPLSIELTINGVAQTVSFPGTSGIYSKKTVALDLDDGANIIKVKNLDSTRVFALDYIYCFPGHGDTTRATGALDPSVPSDPIYGSLVPGVDPQTPYTVTKARFDAVLGTDADGVQTGTLSLANNAGIAIYPGNQTQLPDPTMQAAIDAQFGSDSTPAYRGHCLEVDTNFYLTRWANAFPNRRGLLEHDTIKTLAQVNGHMCERVKMPYYDFSAVALAVRGLRIIGNSRFQPKDVLTTCAHFYNTYFAEVDGQLIARVRGSVTRDEISDEDLGWVEGGDTPETLQLVDVTEPDQNTLPQSLTVSYLSLDRNGDPDSETAIRQITTSVEAQTLNFEHITALPNEARAVAERELFLAEVEKPVKFTTDWSKLYWNVGDVVPVTLTDGSSYMIELKKRSGGIGVLNWEGVLIDIPVFTQPAAGVGGVIEAPPVPITAATFFGLIDSMLLRDKDETNNKGSVIYIYGAPLTNSKQTWPGWSLFFEKVGWERLATITLPATCGRVVAVNGVTGSMLPAVTDTTVKDTVNTLTVDLVTTDKFNPTLESITTADVENGAGAVMAGEECIQVETWTRVGGHPSRWTGSNLWRARRDTDYGLPTHQPYERFVGLNEAVQAVPYSVDDVGVPYDFAGPTISQSLDDGAKVMGWAWTGRSLMPRKILNLIVAQDASHDTFIQFKMQPRPSEEPAEGAVEIWSHDRTTYKRTLNVFPSQGVSAMFIDPDETGFGYDEIYGVIKPPISLTPPDTGYVVGNNLIASTSTSSSHDVKSIQAIEVAGIRIDVTTDVPRSSGVEISNGIFRNYFSLMPADLATGDRIQANIPFTIVWFVSGSIEDDPQDKYIQVYNYATKVYELTSHGMGSAANVRSNETFSFLLIGNECRAYRNYKDGDDPLAVMNLSPSMFPLRIYAAASGGSNMLNFMIRGLTAPTIYSARQRFEDFGSMTAGFHIKAYQKSKYPGIKGIITDFTTP